MRFLFFPLVILSFISGSAQKIFISADSLPFQFNEKWKYFPADSVSLEGKDVDDSNWDEISSSIYTDSLRRIFNGRGWFRIHFKTDSSVHRYPLAFLLKQHGASEVFLDGVMIGSFGDVNDKEGSTYIDPESTPIAFHMNDDSSHTLAVHYVNYTGRENSRIYFARMNGFAISIDFADKLVRRKMYQTEVLSFINILLAGIFVTLSLLHLLLFLYYRSQRSNLYFSIFTFTVFLLFLLGFIGFVAESPSAIYKIWYMLHLLFCLASVSLSAFIKEHFRKGRISFIIILVLFLATLVLRALNQQISILGIMVLGLSVCIEAVITIIIAIVRKQKGARIAGAGILFFGIFIITLFAHAVFAGDLQLNDSTVSGKITLIIAALAILSMPVSMSAYLAWGFAAVNKDLKKQLSEVKILSEKMLEQEQEKKKLLESRKEELENEVTLRTAELRSEKKKSDDLLLNILPSEVAEELKSRGESKARQFDHVSVIFTDIVNFTHITENLGAKELVKEIDILFKAFDEIIGRHGLEKIKTIGDAYLAVCGMPEEDPLHAVKAVRASKEILEYIRSMQEKGGKFALRIGINSGPVVAGIVGVKKFAYDIWGDTVNTAARMEQNSEAGKINISGSTYELVKDHFNCEHRGKIAAKNKGQIDMYFVE
jgi:adenylate cyclase